MKTYARFPLAIALAALWTSPAALWAGPSLPVTKPPVQPTALMTGPMIDPTALHGQWFVDTNGTESVRTNEFYDNVLGGSAGAGAITGYVDSITYAAGPGTPITAFTIQATIFNDTTLEASWGPGTNSHGESLNYQELPYVGPLVDTKLAAEFAITDTNNLPSPFQAPYRDRQPYIVAVNEHQRAWYCWNPDDDNQEHNPKGDYFVPTWDFGTIPVGQSSTRKLSFVVAPPGLQPVGDSRYAAIVSSFATTNDVLVNRTLSLKISTWIDDIALDTGAQQEEPPLRLSDVSVFHNQGEEEPYLDFGDAPDAPYPTLLVNDGARHVVNPLIRMGALIDSEADGQPSLNADGDDLALFDDEDGVVFLSQLIAGQTATVQVTVSTSGYLHAWIDFNANGSWADLGEQILTMSYAPAAGTYTFGIGVPSLAALTNTFARFRFATPQSPLSYTGLAIDGEVEDYPVEIKEEEEIPLDFGDAWDSPVVAGYPTLLIHNGARHAILPGVFLGSAIDSESDGQPSLNADGDDLNPPMGVDDEDGVTLPALLMAGAAAQVQVVASTNGFLNAWIDWNSDGDWADSGEQVFANAALVPGANLLPLSVPLPPAIVAGGPHSRWRFTTYPPALPAYLGPEANGEVEDYEVQLDVLDFGDAPDPACPTLLANDGARHRLPSAYYLGASAPDAEPDGLPSAAADGDDLSATDDEDGVAVGATLVQGDSSAWLSITASTSGYLNAWMDFNGDGDWSDSGEQIASDVPLLTGANPLPFSIPSNAWVGPAPARFRFGSATGLAATGLATDGEVEDHAFTIYQNGPDTNLFLLTNIVYAATNQATIWWAAETAVTYEAQFTTNLLDATDIVWNAWGGYVIGPTNSQLDTNAAERLRFYRVAVPYSPPPP